MAPSQASSCSLFIFLSVLLASVTGSYGGYDGQRYTAKAGTPGMFVFGSSLVDNGNNNFLRHSGVRADYLPYGVDFPSGPSGRFSNGRNTIDALGELLKLPGRIPPFLDPRAKGSRILHGVSYASGGSGILNETRPVGGRVMSLNQQIASFERATLPHLRAQLRRRGRSLSAELPKYFFVMGTGGNDYLLNYFLSGSARAVGVQEFTASLTSSFVSQLKPIGCVPVVRAMLQAANGTCVEAMNEAALLFNRNLSSVVDNLRQQMPGSHLVYVNSYKIITDIIRSPTLHGGFTETNKACCETSPTDGVLCKRGGRICDDRGAYLFFDGLHPTEAVNLRIAEKAYGSHLKTEAYPINIQQLAAL